jgi:TP901 family phage tail tape measure protein
MADVYMRILMSASQGNVMSVIGGIAKSLGGAGLGGALAGVALAAGAAAIGLGVASVKAAGDFQNAMDQNVAHAGLAKDQVQNVTTALMAMGPAVGQGPTELAKALYPILSGFSGITNEGAKTAVSLTELRLAAESVVGTTTSVTTVSNAATGAFNALGLGTNNTATNMRRMNTLFDQMNTTVSSGNMQWAQYANVAGKLATSIGGTTVKWTEANAALATLTNEGYSAQRSQTYLANLFTTMDLKTDSLAKNAKKLGVTFNETAFKSMSLAGQMSYLKEVTGGNSSELLKLMGNNATALKTFNALSAGMGSYKSNLEAIGHSQGATAAAFATASSGWNAAWQRLQASGQALMITLGSKLLPVLTQLVTRVTPIIAAFTGWISSGQAANQIHGVFAQTLSRVQGVLTTLTPTFNVVWMVLKSIGAFLVTTFTPVWTQLVSTVRSQLIPTWQSLMSALAPVMPQLKMFAQVIGGIVAMAIIVLISVIGGLIRAFAGILSGVITIFSGVVQVISGAIKIVSGIIAIFVDLATGNFGKLGTDLGTIMDGIGTMFHGICTIISGIWQAGIGAVTGFVSGFVSTITGIFHNLSNILVGHSIIPEMINAIIVIFTQLPARAGAAISGIIGVITGVLGQAASAALSAGANIVTSIASGITGAIGGAIGGAMSAVGSFISSHLPHSPAKLGPLRDLARQGGAIVEQIASGIDASSPRLISSMTHLVSPVGPALTSARPTGGQSTTIHGGGTTINITISTLANSPSDVRRLADLLEAEIGRRFRTNTPGYAAGGIF